MAKSLQRRGRQAMTRAQSTGGTIATATGTLWIVFAVNMLLLGGSLNQFGIVAWSLPGLVGILFSPLLHASFAHIAMNSVMFVVLGGLLHLKRPAEFVKVSVLGALGSGLGAWLFSAPGTVTVGLSGVLFAYLGYLMLRGVFERSFWSVALSLGVTWLFGSLVWGVLPLTAGVSWQAHLFGFLTGLLLATRKR